MLPTLKPSTSIIYNCCRRYSTSWEEIRIPMPWGHIAGKWWGPKNQQPVLTNHGWQDNCGSFDRLIPLLPKTISFLTYDLPGHGLSSKIPQGFFYHSIDAAILIKRIMEYFNWSKVSLMGHSLGSSINFVYTMLFPETVNFLVCLDLLKPHLPDDQLNRTRKAIDDFLKYDHFIGINSEPPSVPFKEMEQKLHQSTRAHVALENCKYILNRNVLPSSYDSNKIYLTRDPRLKTYNIINWSQESILQNLHRMTCHIFLVLASNSPVFEKINRPLEVIDALKKLNTNFEVYNVEGTHHVHLNNPERVAELITSFLNKCAKDDISDKSEVVAFQ